MELLKTFNVIIIIILRIDLNIINSIIWHFYILF